MFCYWSFLWPFHDEKEKASPGHQVCLAATCVVLHVPLLQHLLLFELLKLSHLKLLMRSRMVGVESSVCVSVLHRDRDRTRFSRGDQQSSALLVYILSVNHSRLNHLPCSGIQQILGSRGAKIPEKD